MKSFQQALIFMLLSFLVFSCDNPVTDSNINAELPSLTQSELNVTSSSLSSEVIAQCEYNGGIITSFRNMNNEPNKRFEMWYGTDANPFQMLLGSNRFPLAQHMVSYMGGIVTGTDLFGRISVEFRPDPLGNWNHFFSVISRRSSERLMWIETDYGDYYLEVIIGHGSYLYGDIFKPKRLYLNFSLDELPPVLASCTSEGSAYNTDYSPRWTPGLWWERQQHVLYFNPPDKIKVTVTTNDGITDSTIIHLNGDGQNFYYSTRKVENNNQVIGNFYQDIYREEYGFRLPSTNMSIEIQQNCFDDITDIDSIVNVSISPAQCDLLKDRRHFSYLFRPESDNSWLNIAMLTDGYIPESFIRYHEVDKYLFNRWETQLQYEGRYQDSISNLHLNNWSIHYGTYSYDPYWIIE